jgi:ribosomal protein S27AE
MILEVIVGSLTFIVLGSLWFADRVLKREDGEDKPKSEVKLYPHQHPGDNKGCPFCGTAVSSKGSTERIFGVNEVGKACVNPDKCEAGHLEHLHAHCVSCGTSFFMELCVNKKKSP